jgi:hypothetical protein
MKTTGWKANYRAALMGIAMVGALAVARPAWADTLSVSADLPVSSSITVKQAANAASGNPASTTTFDSKSISGYTLGLSFPFLIGLGYENYSSSLSKGVPAGTLKFDYDVTMYDIFLNLPLPVINIAIGAGMGTGKIANEKLNGVSQTSTSKDADLTQWFASLGIPVAKLVDLHVGYHSFSGTNKTKTVTQSDRKVDGSMYSVGVKIGF